RSLVEFTRSGERPYPLPTDRNAARAHEGAARHETWQHQQEAIAAFLGQGQGVLEMATGTGKTRTALSILNELHARALIKTAVVTAFGTDLLDQWYRELVHRSPFAVYRSYGIHKEALAYLNNPTGGLLLASRQALAEILPRLSPSATAHGLIVADEVHGMGS